MMKLILALLVTLNLSVAESELRKDIKGAVGDVLSAKKKAVDNAAVNLRAQADAAAFKGKAEQEIMFKAGVRDPELKIKREKGGGKMAADAFDQRSMDAMKARKDRYRGRFDRRGGRIMGRDGRFKRIGGRYRRPGYGRPGGSMSPRLDRLCAVYCAGGDLSPRWERIADVRCASCDDDGDGDEEMSDEDEDEDEDEDGNENDGFSGLGLGFGGGVGGLGYGGGDFEGGGFGGSGFLGGGGLDGYGDY